MPKRPDDEIKFRTGDADPASPLAPGDGIGPVLMAEEIEGRYQDLAAAALSAEEEALLTEAAPAPDGGMKASRKLGKHGVVLVPVLTLIVLGAAAAVGWYVFLR